MSRIVAGEARGRRLIVPDGRDTRPTSDRVREALFASLEADLGDLSGRRFLDLYAGSGAVGIEALSRGASYVLLVESSRRAAAVVRRNLDTVGLPGGQLVTTRVERLVASPPPETDGRQAFDVAFLDPPYAMDAAAVSEILRALLANGWLVADAIVVVERPTRAGEFTWPDGFTADRMRRYGDTSLWYGRATGSIDTQAETEAWCGG
ncbi:MAG TPA: 16S rRNA (guanine(966)-N(2))-methyltransferase RsmD [Actinopolymorphaceae bacterium]|jgi:16S rRNA (guanine966-N2)-methyltransferase